MRRIATVVALVVLAAALTGCGAKAPNLVGMSQDDATATLQAAGLKAGDISYDASSTAAPWSVIGQDPAAGMRPGDGAVDLVLAGGVPTMVPTVTDMSRKEAEQALGNAKLVLARVDVRWDDLVAPGFVCAQSPGGGEKVPEGSQVTLIVSKGGSPVDVPSVIGQPFATAKQQLTDLGFVVKSKTVDNPATKGTVLKQDIDGGPPAQYGDTIILVLADGSQKVRVPDLYFPQDWGKPGQAEKLSALLAPLGLKVSWSETSGEFYQAPAKRTMVPPGTVVTVRTPSR